MRKIDRHDLWMWFVPFDEAGIHLKPLAIWVSIYLATLILTILGLPK